MIAAAGATINATINATISKRKLRASHRGRPAGTGPRTAAGKARSAQNARRHGLCAPVRNSVLDAEAAAAAAAIAGEHSCPHLHALARRIADAQIDLRRVRAERRAVVARAFAEPGCRPPEGLDARRALLRRAAGLLNKGETLPPDMREDNLTRRDRGTLRRRPVGAERKARHARSLRTPCPGPSPRRDLRLRRCAAANASRRDRRRGNVPKRTPGRKCNEISNGC